MSDHSPKCLRPTDTCVPIYPPPWYLDLVRLRSSRIEDAHARPCMFGELGPKTLDSDGAERAKLMALALEIVRPPQTEGLPFGHLAHVLGLDVLEVREYLGERFRDLDVRAPAPTLIIEDEATVALDLARIVRQTGHRVCGTAGHLKQAVALAGRTHPMLVLADVQLKDGPEAGIAAVREIRRWGETATVYVTAYPERVRHAVVSPFIVSKPFVARNIQMAIWRALFRHSFAPSTSTV